MSVLHHLYSRLTLVLRQRSALAFLLLAAIPLSGCVAVEPTTSGAATETSSVTTAPAQETTVDLSGVKGYLLDQATALKDSAATLKGYADSYYPKGRSHGL